MNDDLTENNQTLAYKVNKSTGKDPIDKIAKALSKAQGEMCGVVKNKKNEFLKSSYADLASAYAACRDALYDNQLAITHCIEYENGQMLMVTKLIHESGQEIKSVMPIVDQKNVQTLGSTLTYLRRYSVMSLLALAPVEDDDGNTSIVMQAKAKNDSITKDQVVFLEDLLKDQPELKLETFIFAKIHDLSDLPKDLFDLVKDTVTKRIKQRKSKANENN